MEGVTTALVGFIFVSVVYPTLIKNRPQFYAALGMVCAIILLDSLGRMFLSFAITAYCLAALLQIGTILLLFLAAGGLSVKQLAGELGNAYEVIRRGGEKKEVIIPLTGAMPKPRQQPRAIDPQPPGRIAIDDPDPSGQVPLE
jgi:hypothetical protein